MQLPPIVDAHCSLGVPGAPDEALAPLLAKSGVERTVLVQPEPSIDASRAALNAAESTDFVAAAVVWVDAASRDIDGTLGRLSRSRKLRGVCLPAHLEEDNHWLMRPDVLRGLRAAAKRGLSLDVIVEPRQLPSARDLAREIPDLRIAVAHLGSPFIGRGEREPWGVAMLRLAPMPNVFLKMSGLVSLDAEPWNAARVKLFVEPSLRLFGYRRVMFGSDWPRHGERASYREVVRAAVEAAGPTTDAQLADLLGGTASRFYRLPDA